VRRCLRDPTFSRFDTIPECDRQTHTQTHRHTTTAYTALSIASHGKNKAIVDGRLRPQCATHDEYLVFIVEQTLVGIDAVISAVTLSERGRYPRHH